MTPLRRAALFVLALSLFGAALGSWRLLSIRREAADLKADTASRQARLADDRKVAATAPRSAKPVALDRSRAVSRLREALAALARQRGFRVQEFEASTEELPYLSAYAKDTQAPGWMQVPVRAALQGRSTALMAGIAALREAEAPFEIDTIEFTRRSTDDKGMATVSASLGMRVLVYRGEG